MVWTDQPQPFFRYMRTVIGLPPIRCAWAFRIGEKFPIFLTLLMVLDLTVYATQPLSSRAASALSSFQVSRIIHPRLPVQRAYIWSCIFICYWDGTPAATCKVCCGWTARGWTRGGRRTAYSARTSGGGRCLWACTPRKKLHPESDRIGMESQGQRGNRKLERGIRGGTHTPSMHKGTEANLSEGDVLSLARVSARA